MQNPNKTPTLKARIGYSKTGLMQWVGHLDLMRFFQKAIRRADLPIAYSNGFHPHQLLSFALPLGIGTTSEQEYMDVEFLEKLPEEEVVTRLNKEMPEGMEVLSCHYLPGDAKKAMSIVAAARYALFFKDSTSPKVQSVSDEEWEAAIRRFYSEAPEIRVTKKTKKGERELDLKPLIYEFSHDNTGFVLLLSAGSVDNIKPALVFSHFMKDCGFEESVYAVGVRRMALYAKDDRKKLINLGAY